MRKYRFTVLIERDEDGYLVTTVPSLKSCYTPAKTMEELLPRVKEVIELSLQEEEPVPMSFEAVQ
jgi:predicted RNase H-like HicB family nuclease